MVPMASRELCSAHLEVGAPVPGSIWYPQNSCLPGNSGRVLAGILNRIKTRSYWIGMGPESNDCVLIRRGEKTDTQGENHEDTEAEINVSTSQRMPRIAGATRSWEKGTGGILS